MKETEEPTQPTAEEIKKYQEDWAERAKRWANEERARSEVAQNFARKRERYIKRQENIDVSRTIATEVCAYFAAIMALVIYFTK